MSALVMAVCAGRLGVWQLEADGRSTPLTIKGEATPSASQPAFFVEALTEARERSRLDGTAAVHWVADAEGRKLLLKALEKLKLADKHAQHPWQIIDWAWLRARFALDAPAPWDCDAVWRSEVLPWLACAETRERARELNEALTREYQGKREALEAELERLRQENARLSRQNAALRRMDIEPLLAFLPALYEKVFTVLGPADLALLCGQVEPPAIPNPYPEPSAETLHVLQQDFLALPREKQREIVGFVFRLPQRRRLTVRAKLREPVRQIEAELAQEGGWHGQG